MQGKNVCKDLKICNVMLVTYVQRVYVLVAMHSFITRVVLNTVWPDKWAETFNLVDWQMDQHTAKSITFVQTVQI